MGTPPVTDDLGPLTFSPGTEDWIEYGLGESRTRIGFHDYAALYSVTGLYERVFYDELGMRSSQRVVGMYARVLRDLGRSPHDERVVEVGAGNGLGGEELRRLGVGRLTGIDLEPQARMAAHRDRPGTYDDYLVGDLLRFADAELAQMAAAEPTTVLALSALGPGHAPPAALDRALRLLTPGGLFAFAVTPTLLPDSDDARGLASGYPDFLRGLFAERADELAREAYVHRLRPDGSEDPAVAFVGRLRTHDRPHEPSDRIPAASTSDTAVDAARVRAGGEHG